MTTSDGIYPHISENSEFTMHSILIQGRSQTSEIMMLADTIDLDIFSIQEETFLGIKPHIPETSSSCNLIDYLSISH